jgi:hypothetical protein
MRGMDNIENPPALPPRTTPTWEVELLISGVAVFAMLQLPGWLDDAMFAVEPRLDQQWRMVAILAYIYSKSAAVVLAATFALHLLLRAQWVAQMGVHSVFPDGIRTNQARMGPIQREIESQSADDPEAAIERADNRASITFAFGVTIAMMIVVVCICFCGAMLLATLLSKAFGLHMDTLLVVGALLMLMALPVFIAVSADYYLKDRIKPGTALHRWVSATIRLYTRLGMGRRSNRILATLMTNQSEKRTLLLLTGIMLLAIIGVFIAYLAMVSKLDAGSYSLFPDTRQLRIDAAHYDDQRNPNRAAATPYIDSMVVNGPYLRLTIPYEPRRDDPAMRRCAHPASTDDLSRSKALLTCLQRVRGVLLDGKPMQNLQYDVASDSRTDRPALLAMIDIRSLNAGRHELMVARPPAEGSRRDEKDPGNRYYHIPFWR